MFIPLLFCNEEKHTDLSKNKNELANPRTSLTTVMFCMLKGDTVKIKQITTDRYYSSSITKSEVSGQKLQTIGNMLKENFDKIKWDKLTPNQTEYCAACNVDLRIG
jgi:hypothetical protein